MRILMLTPRFPYPPDRGDRLHSWGIIRALTLQHEVWLACVDTEAPRPDDLACVQDYCREVAVFVRPAWKCLAWGAVSLLAGASITEGYFDDPRLVQVLRDWSQRTQFDAVLTYSSSLGTVGASVPARRHVADFCDVDSAKWATYARRSWLPLRWLYRREARRVLELEARCAAANDLVLLVNERERRKFRRLGTRVATDVLPTAIDTAHYGAAEWGPAPVPAAPIVGMVGSMFYPPNVRAVNWFGRYVWPLVRARVPAARWRIVGAAPRRSVRAWQHEDGVEVVGHVTDVRAHLRDMRVFVNAVDGDIGVQSKLIVALAAGRPAVVTPDSAAGIDYGDPPPFIIAASPQTFADAVVRLLRDDAHATALATRARATAAWRYDVAEQIARLTGWLAADAAPSGRATTSETLVPARPGVRAECLGAGGHW